MANLLARIVRLEALSPRAHPVPRRFMVKGSVDATPDQVEAFLRACGHRPETGDIVIKLVGARDGKPSDLPWSDLTEISDVITRPAAEAL